MPLTSDDRDVAAPPCVPHLAADLTLRASARHPNVHLLDAFMACIIRSSSYNNNNNKMTSLAPVSSENPSSVAQQNQRIRHYRYHVQCKKSSTDVWRCQEAKEDRYFYKIGFQIMANLSYISC